MADRDWFDELERMFGGEAHEGAIPIVTPDRLDVGDTVKQLLASLEDATGFGPGVCAGCGRMGQSLLKDSVGVWCGDCGGAGQAQGPMPAHLRVVK